MSSHQRIDVHAHFVPPEWRTVCEQNGQGQPDGMPAIPPWTPSTHLSAMNRLSITKSILSITSPGTSFPPLTPPAATTLTRACNTYAAHLRTQHPTRFDFFASLPLPHIPAALAEIAHSLTHLRAAGVALLTNYAGVYLGDPVFDPVFAELNARRAVVFIHPAGPCVAHAGAANVAALPLPQFPAPMFEFFFDTARAVVNLFLSGTVARCPEVRFVLPHGGGVLPPLIERFAGFSTGILRAEVRLSADMVRESLRRQFWFDLAGFVWPDVVEGAVRVVGWERLVYGTDYPYTPREGAEMLMGRMEEGLGGLGEEVRDGVWGGNAERLLGERFEGVAEVEKVQKPSEVDFAAHS